MLHLLVSTYHVVSFCFRMSLFQKLAPIFWRQASFSQCIHNGLAKKWSLAIFLVDLTRCNTIFPHHSSSNLNICAPLAELVDAQDSKSCSFIGVPVRFRRGAPFNHSITSYTVR